MSSSDLVQQSVGATAASFDSADLLRAMISGRSILQPEELTDTAAADVVGRLHEFARKDESPVAMILTTDGSDYGGTMLVLDHIRLCPVPVLGVVVTSIGALTTVLLQACTTRFATRRALFELSMMGGWSDASITLHARVAPGEVRGLLLRAAARRRLRFDALSAALADRTSFPAAEWDRHVKERDGVSLDEALRVGLIDAIID